MAMVSLNSNRSPKTPPMRDGLVQAVEGLIRTETVSLSKKAFFRNLVLGLEQCKSFLVRLLPSPAGFEFAIPSSLEQKTSSNLHPWPREMAWSVKCLPRKCRVLVCILSTHRKARLGHIHLSLQCRGQQQRLVPRAHWIVYVPSGELWILWETLSQQKRRRAEVSLTWGEQCQTDGRSATSFQTKPGTLRNNNKTDFIKKKGGE